MQDTYATYTESGYPETPKLTDHARERCQQMGISTKVAKKIWRERTLVRPLISQDRVIVHAASVPDFVICVDPAGWLGVGGAPVIVTVLFNETEHYERDGQGGYRVLGLGLGESA